MNPDPVWWAHDGDHERACPRWPGGYNVFSWGKVRCLLFSCSRGKVGLVIQLSGIKERRLCASIKPPRRATRSSVFLYARLFGPVARALSGSCSKEEVGEVVEVITPNACWPGDPVDLGECLLSGRCTSWSRSTCAHLLRRAAGTRCRPASSAPSARRMPSACSRSREKVNSGALRKRATFYA